MDPRKKVGRTGCFEFAFATLVLLLGTPSFAVGQTKPADDNSFLPSEISRPYLADRISPPKPTPLVEDDRSIQVQESRDNETKPKREAGSKSEHTEESAEHADVNENEEFEECEECELEEEGTLLKAKFEDGFTLVSEDEEFELKIHILNQVDYKLFSPEEQEPAAIDGVYIPRMRVYFEGKLTDPFRYEISLQRSVEGEFDILDANLDIMFRKEFQIRFGRTLIPYSYTWYDHLEQYFIVPERPLFPLNYGLSRAAGIQIWGEDTFDRWQYSLGIYDGRTAGIADDSTITDFVTYVNFRPFVNRGDGLLQYLNVGGSFVVGKSRRESEVLPGRTSIQSSENDEAANAASAVFLEFNPFAVGFGNRTIGAIHAALYRGPVSFEAEWNALNVDSLNEVTDEMTTVGAQGFHITCASFITGETVRAREVVEPLRPFDPRCGCKNLGAFEPFARYSYLAIGDEIFTSGLAEEADFTNRVSMTDLGINWYLNRYTKFYFNWQHAGYDSPVLVNEETGQRSRYNDLFWVRCQLYF